MALEESTFLCILISQKALSPSASAFQSLVIHIAYNFYGGKNTFLFLKKKSTLIEFYIGLFISHKSLSLKITWEAHKQNPQPNVLEHGKSAVYDIENVEGTYVTPNLPTPSSPKESMKNKLAIMRQHLDPDTVKGYSPKEKRHCSFYIVILFWFTLGSCVLSTEHNRTSSDRTNEML